MGGLKKLIDNEKFKEIIRFGITGAVSTLVTYAVYYVCLWGLNANVSFIIGYLVAMIVNYLMTTSYTFKVKATKGNAAGFLLSNGINYALCALFLNIFLWIGVRDKFAPIPTYAVAIPVNFLIVRFVMKKK